MFSHKGPRLDLAVLSGLAHHHRVASLEDSSWNRRVLESPRIQADLHLPSILDLQPGEFWTSGESVAHDLEARWRFADVAEDQYEGAFGDPEFLLGFGPRVRKPLSYPNIKRFHKNVRNSVKRQEQAGRVRRERTVQFAKQKAGSMGAVFTVHGVSREIQQESLISLPAPDLLLLHPRGPEAALKGLLDAAEDDDALPVVDLVGAAYVTFDAFTREPDGMASTRRFRERADPTLAVRPYRAIEVRDNIRRPGRPGRFPTWPARQARRGVGTSIGPESERHHSIGAWHEDGGGPRKRSEDAPFLVPWLVLDFDRGNDVEAALEAAQRVAVELLQLGLDPDDLVCCPTGGRGAHLLVPCGAFGTPLYRSSGAAKGALGRLVRDLVDEEIDPALLSPLHLVRAVGSGYYVAPHAASIAPGFPPPVGFKVRVPTSDFVGLPAFAAVAASRTFAPSRLRDPRLVEPVPALAAAASRAAYGSGLTRAGASWKSRAVVAVEGGVDVGARNQAAFVMATYFLDQGNLGEADALKALRDWNTRNSTPLPDRDLKIVHRSAMRRVLGR